MFFSLHLKEFCFVTTRYSEESFPLSGLRRTQKHSRYPPRILAITAVQHTSKLHDPGAPSFHKRASSSPSAWTLGPQPCREPGPRHKSGYGRPPGPPSLTRGQRPSRMQRTGQRRPRHGLPVVTLQCPCGQGVQRAGTSRSTSFSTGTVCDPTERRDLECPFPNAQEKHEKTLVLPRRA